MTDNQRTKHKKTWLKKYTKLDYLTDILSNRVLYLGDPDGWEDKNDSDLVKLYSVAYGINGIRATCLTEAQDRFHFWAIFGERKKGVCLWFDKQRLLADIRQDESLDARHVEYRNPKSLGGLEKRLLPFAKREQYKDEREFRVMRTGVTPGSVGSYFQFSAGSLKRIYLNPWLPGAEVDEWKGRLRKVLVGEFGHVEVKQNRSLRHKKWIQSAEAVLGRPD